MGTQATTVTTEQHGDFQHHVVRTGVEWCHIVLNPARNLVLCYGPTGNYNFSWHAPGEDFITFLDRLSFDYAMSKFLGREKHLSIEGSVQVMREIIVAYCRDESLTAQQARECWLAVRTAERGARSDFASAIEAGDFARHFAGSWYDYFHYDHGPQAQHFWNLIWRPLMAHLTHPQAA